MKKKLLVFGGLFTALGLSAFGLLNWNTHISANCQISSQHGLDSSIAGSTIDPLLSEIKLQPKETSLLYQVGTRFNWSILKSDLLKARTVNDIFPPSIDLGIDDYYESEIALLPLPEGETGVMGNNGLLNEEQLTALATADYSDNFFVQARYKRLNPQTGKEEKDYIVYYTSILPEKAASYSLGYEALIDYLKEESATDIGIIEEDKLKPGRFNFIISRNGEVTEVEMDESSGYPSVDQKLIRLLQSLPAKWQPAMNEAGEPVEQKLVFFFGQMGC